MKIYNLIKKVAMIIYKKPKVYLPKDFDKNTPSIFMCNHEKNYGPIMFALYFPYDARPWAHSEVVNYDESLEYICKRFFIDRLKLNVKLARLLSKIVLKPLNYVVNMNNPITIYHDGIRGRNTIVQSVNSIMKKENQVIFGTNLNPVMINGKINPKFDFHKGYLLVAKQAIELGVVPKIYPVSFNKRKATISIGEPITINLENHWAKEKKRINYYLTNEVKYGYLNPSRIYKSKVNSITKVQQKFVCNDY